MSDAAIKVSVWGSEFTHRLNHADPTDRRLGWTACGLRFVWGRVDPRWSADRCQTCWP